MPTEKRQRQKEGQQARKEAAVLAARKEQRKKRRIVMAILVVVVFAVMGLLSLTGKDDKKGTSATSTGSTTTTTEASTTPTSAPPEAPAPGGDTPVTKLQIEDLKVGTGAVVKKGDTIVAHYYGATYKDGKKFQSSWDSGQTFETTVADGALIQGWVDGIPGMKVGGRRKLTIPQALAYPDPQQGQPAGDLVFIIDVYAVK